MERFLIKKLIVISDNEKASYEATFEKGLNIIIGANKTGKSSIIKSIFYTLGCETDMEASWKKLIDTYILFFDYGINSYCLIRQGKKYKIFKMYGVDCQISLLCNVDNYDDYTIYLLKKIFKIEAELVTKKGKVMSFIPPVLFRFQYIDQDQGWRKLGESFTNVNFINDWRKHSIKFVIGYQGEEYFLLKKQINIVAAQIIDLKVKQNHFAELFESITESLSDKGISLMDKQSLDDLKRIIDEILSELSIFEREKISIRETVSRVKNEIYEKNLELIILKKTIEHIDEDHNFAIDQDDEIQCPVCGMTYNNSISDRVELVKDVQSGDELISSYRKDISELQATLEEEDKKKHELMKKIHILKINLREKKEVINIAELYKNEGRKEIINVSENERKKVVQDILTKEFEKSGYESEVKTLESRKRINQIKNDFIDIYETILEKVSISNSYIKLTSFIQKLENTGSERPRIILSYHLALYLYGLKRGENPYNWLIIDTPNQQGQDATNLKNIDSLMDLMVMEKGQVIIGTERETGYEDKANKIVKLTEYKRCLEPNNYKKHKELLLKFDELIGK